MIFINLLWLFPLGYLIGSLLNYFSDVLPQTKRIIEKPYCDNCGQTFDFINYITFSDCQNCRCRPKLRMYIVAILAILIIPLIYFFPPAYTGWILALIIFSYLGLVFIIDLEHRLILHPVSLVGGILFLIIGIYLNGWKVSLIGLLGGFGIMYILYLLGILFGKIMAKSRGQEIDEIALGFGDVTLSTILGLLIGWPRIGVTLFFAIVLGGIFSGLFLLSTVLMKKYKAFTAIPYAPFIIISAVVLIYLSSGNR